MSSLWSASDAPGQLLAGPAQRQHDLEVDVEVVVVLPPREVRRLVGRQAAVEDGLLLLGQPGAGGRRWPRRARPSALRAAASKSWSSSFSRKVLMMPSAVGVVLDPARQRRRRRWRPGGGRRPARKSSKSVSHCDAEPPCADSAARSSPGSLSANTWREPGLPGLDREPVQLPVQLHDLGVLALEELADEVGVDAQLGAGPVEAEEVDQHRVHDVEVDLHRALVVAAAPAG